MNENYVISRDVCVLSSKGIQNWSNSTVYIRNQVSIGQNLLHTSAVNNRCHRKDKTKIGHSSKALLSRSCNRCMGGALINTRILSFILLNRQIFFQATSFHMLSIPAIWTCYNVFIYTTLFIPAKLNSTLRPLDFLNLSIKLPEMGNFIDKLSNPLYLFNEILF